MKDRHEHRIAAAWAMVTITGKTTTIHLVEDNTIADLLDTYETEELVFLVGPTVTSILELWGIVHEDIISDLFELLRDDHEEAAIREAEELLL